MGKKRLKKRWKFLLAVLILLILIRLSLPYYVTFKLNQSLAEIGDYSGHVNDVDLHLFRGAYIIDSLRIDHVKNDIETPFVVAPRIDLSLEWSALFKGRIVGEVLADNLVINFFLSEEEEKNQTGTTENWVEVVESLLPIEINRFTVRNGNITYGFVTGDFEQNADLEDVSLVMTNIRNVVRSDELLPSEVNFSAHEKNFGGKINLEGKANFLKSFPDFDYNAEVSTIDLTQLNPLMKHFLKMDFESGTIKLYSEMAVRGRQLEGYFKPVLNEAKVFSLIEEDRNLISAIREFLAEMAQEIFERRSTQETATKLSYTGSIDDFKGDYWTAIVIALRNAYWQAITQEIDHSIEIGDVKITND